MRRDRSLLLRRSHQEGYQIILLKFINLSCGLLSAVHIRLFVPPFVDGLVFQREKHAEMRIHASFRVKSNRYAKRNPLARGYTLR
jgi:hypothetical protein